MTTVLDASALLAYLQSEPGMDIVRAVLAESVISSVNWAEVVQKLLAVDVNTNAVRQNLGGTGLSIESFTLADGEMAGRLWLQTRRYGLSLGDRACLSLGIRLGARVLTGDRAWQSLNLSINIQLLR